MSSPDGSDSDAHGRPPGSFLSQLGAYFSPPKAPFAWLVILVLLVLLLVAFSVMTKGSFLQTITDVARVRSLITVAITFSTIFFALILIVQAFVGTDGDANDANERFRRAREIFTVLTGILGTIVGFYFGSATSDSKGLVVTGAKIVDVGGGAVVAQVEGGTPPYHYRIGFSEKALPAIERDLASPGWVFETFAARSGVVAFITVVDSARREVSATAGPLLEEPDKARAPSPLPNPVATTPAPETTAPAKR